MIPDKDQKNGYSVYRASHSDALELCKLQLADMVI